jgi:hypothetical protein
LFYGVHKDGKTLEAILNKELFVIPSNKTEPVASVGREPAARLRPSSEAHF